MIDCVQAAGLCLSENDNIFSRCVLIRRTYVCLSRTWTSTPTLQKFHQRNPRALLPWEQRWAKGEDMARSASHRNLDQNKERERLTHAAQLRLGLLPTLSVATMGGACWHSTVWHLSAAGGGWSRFPLSPRVGLYSVILGDEWN